MAAPSKNQQEIALLKEQIELEKLKQQLQRQDEIMMLTLQIQKEKEKSMRREEVALKRELDKAIRRQQIEDIRSAIESEQIAITKAEINKIEIENLRKANSMKRKVREARLARFKEKKLEMLAKQKKELELERERRHMMRELEKAGEQKAELEAQYLEAQNRKKRMESLEAKVKWYEDRLKKEEDPIPLDVTLPKWGSPFAQTLSVRKLEISSGSVDLLTAPVSTFEDLEFVGFSPAESIMCGSLRSNPFGKGTFRYSYFAQLSKKRYVMKHMIDSYHKPEDELTDLQEAAATHFLGKLVVQEWNKQRPNDCVEFEMLSCDVVLWENPPLTLLPGGEATRQYWTLEPHLADAFKKFNNNGNFQDDDHPAAHALSHFSYELSGRKWMLVDVQGSCNASKTKYTLTDPAFHTETGKGFGGTNMGPKGFDQFFATHTCSDVCRQLGLKPVTL